MEKAVFIFLVLLASLHLNDAIQCYQCDSDFDVNCWPDRPFDKKLNALVDCLSDEAHSPGTFCMKIEYRSSGWWGWHKVTRRCGASTSLGSTETCAYGLEDTGVYVRKCNCNTDGCNAAYRNSHSIFGIVLSIFLLVLLY